MVSKESIIIDTGPLIAALNSKDKHHAWTLKQLGQLSPPFYTSESVFSEACFILTKHGIDTRPLFDFLRIGAVKVNFDLNKEVNEIRKAIHKYSDRPMSLADASLVRMSEKIKNSTVLTFDSDFRVYRKQNRQVISVLMPH